MKKQVSVVIGKFNPPHRGHFHLLDKALENADLLIICIGSHKSAPSSKNLFQTNEIASIIDSHYKSDKIKFCYIEDNLYSDTLWSISVKQQVNKIAFSNLKEDFKVSLYGHNKDTSSDYLTWFPQWDLVEADAYLEDGKVLHATDYRAWLLSDNDFNLSLDKFLTNVVELFTSKEAKQRTIEILLEKVKNNSYTWLHQEFNYYKNYKQSFSVLPYPPIFVTVDAVVFCNNHVLVIERAKSPGKGLLALAGGFIEQHETVEQGIIRELVEETKIDVPLGKLKNSLIEVIVYDAPNRSLRGRTITHAGLIVLRGEKTLPKVKGADDAASAKWIPVDKVIVNQNRYFEDHFHIIQDMLRKI